MKKYTFRLEQVRRIRRVQEDQAKMNLQSANHEVNKAIGAVNRSLDHYENASAAVALGLAPTDDFMRLRYLNELAGQAVTAAREAQAKAEEFAAVRREEWSEAATKVKALDRLDERRRDEYNIEFERESVKEIDDIVNGRFKRETDDVNGRFGLVGGERV